jgi:hypothetical protein
MALFYSAGGTENVVRDLFTAFDPKPYDPDKDP